MPRSISVIALLTLALASGACSKKQPPEIAPPPPRAVAPAPAPSGPAGIVPGSQADFVQRMAGRNVIYFDTDRSNIDDVDAAALRAQAEWLTQYPNKRATIEGHADERGTRDYNLALGERRANAAKNYLSSLGIAASRIDVVSYGEERPASVGSNEAAWAQNRRAVTVTID